MAPSLPPGFVLPTGTDDIIIGLPAPTADTIGDSSSPLLPNVVIPPIFPPQIRPSQIAPIQGLGLPAFPSLLPALVTDVLANTDVFGTLPTNSQAANVLGALPPLTDVLGSLPPTIPTDMVNNGLLPSTDAIGTLPQPTDLLSLPTDVLSLPADVLNTALPLVTDVFGNALPLETDVLNTALPQLPVINLPTEVLVSAFPLVTDVLGSILPADTSILDDALPASLPSLPTDLAASATGILANPGLVSDILGALPTDILPTSLLNNGLGALITDIIPDDVLETLLPVVTEPATLPILSDLPGLGALNDFFTDALGGVHFVSDLLNSGFYPDRAAQLGCAAKRHLD